MQHRLIDRRAGPLARASSGVVKTEFVVIHVLSDKLLLACGVNPQVAARECETHQLGRCAH